jgi:hypothetical protein
MKTLSEFPAAIRELTDWCLGQKDLTGFAIAILPPLVVPDSVVLCVKVEIGGMRGEQTIRLRDNAPPDDVRYQIDGLIMSLDRMMDEARQKMVSKLPGRGAAWGSAPPA